MNGQSPNRPQVEDPFSCRAWSAIEVISDNATANAQATAELRFEEEIETALEEEAFEKVIEIGDSFVASGRVDSSSRPEPLIAYILYMKAIAYEQLEDFQAMIEVSNDIIERFGTFNDLQPQLVALALINKGFAQVQRGEFGAAISSYDEVIERFGISNLSNLQGSVATALLQKCNIQVEVDNAEEALHTCEELERRCGVLSKDEKIWFEWRVMFMRTRVMLALEKCREALEVFRSGYAAFPLNDEVTMHAMQLIVPTLIANGASERDLIEILSSDKEKLDALVPLIVALLQRTGEEVRAPVEVLEVAKDINKDIERRMAD